MLKQQLLRMKTYSNWLRDGIDKGVVSVRIMSAIQKELIKQEIAIHQPSLAKVLARMKATDDSLKQYDSFSQIVHKVSKATIIQACNAL